MVTTLSLERGKTQGVSWLFEHCVFQFCLEFEIWKLGFVVLTLVIFLVLVAVILLVEIVFLRILFLLFFLFLFLLSLYSEIELF